MAFLFLVLYLFIVLIRPQDLVAAGAYANVPIILYTLLITIVSFAISKHKFRSSPQLILLFLMLIVICFSSALNGWIGGIPPLINRFSSFALIPFILFSSILNTPTKQKVVMIVCIVCGLIMVHQGISQKASVNGIGWSGAMLSEGTRITYLGLLNDPNDLGMFFVMTLPMAVYFVVKVRKIYKILPLFAVDYLLYGIYLTNSRGALLTVFAQCALWGLRKFGFKKIFLIAIPVIPAMLIVMTKFRSIDSDGESSHGRVDAWYSGFEMFKSNPLFGVGMNNFTEYNHLTAHNSYVLVLAELGAIGFTLWISFLFLTVTMLYRVVTYNNSFIQPTNKLKELILDEQTVNEEEKSEQVSEEVMLANIAIYSMLGFMMTAFFLSRTYFFLLYIYAGIFVACNGRVLALIPEFEIMKLSNNILRLVRLAIFGIIGLFFVTKVLI